MIVVQNIVWLVVLIGVMILVHEAGHYWAARFFDVRIDVFSFGFGPRLFGFRRGETDFRISAILFGGYVKMAGEQPTDEDIDDPRAFLAKPRWQRLIIAFAGPAMNMVLAVALVTGLFMAGYPRVLDADREAVVGYVQPGSPAAAAGAQTGDRIVNIDGLKNPTWEDIEIKEFASGGHSLQLALERDNRTIWTHLTPKLDERTGVGVAGWQAEGEVEIAETQASSPASKAGLRRDDVLLKADGQPLRSLHRLQEIIEAANGKPIQVEYLRNGAPRQASIQPMYTKDTDTGTNRWLIGVLLQPRMITVRLGLPDAVREAVNLNVRSASLFYQFLRGLIARRMSPKSLSGPIGIARLSGQAARAGPMAFVELMAMVSLQLAVFNLLPIPILDGAVILLLMVEMVMRRDLSLRVKETVFKLGFVFLMAIMAFTIYNDISKMLPG